MESPINIFNINQEKPKKRKRVSATLNKAGKAITAVTNRLHQPSNIRQKLLGRQISEARTKQIDLDIETSKSNLKQRNKNLSISQLYVPSVLMRRIIGKRLLTIESLNFKKKEKK